MRIALYIPCYIDQFYPQVGKATLRLLEGLGLHPEFPLAQTCCGQPVYNMGCRRSAKPLAQRFVEIFAPYDAVICPSGSCVSMVRNHYGDLLGDDPDYIAVRKATYELCTYLHDVLQVTSLDARFPHRVGLHQGCHGLRELDMGSPSELMIHSCSKVAKLLGLVEGLSLVDLKRPDECCGFGGTFSVMEEAVSCSMGRDRIADHRDAGAEVITGADSSCLMHLEGLERRRGGPMRFLHVAEILAGGTR
ncbi:MAG: (Fe-S)-binding protein [Verrucomicrobia bacterium]|nr:(Fe-S)-binding protein [Verrucomicrobiota bacterium]